MHKKMIKTEDQLKGIDFFHVHKRTFNNYCQRCNNLVEVMSVIPWKVIIAVWDKERCKLPAKECFEEK